ncbi:CPBP family intramembrane glutamic endopeptidase [Oceanithermus sp.]
MNSFFILTDGQQPRMRLGWRLLFHALLMVFFSFLLEELTNLLESWWPGVAFLDANGVVDAVALTLATWLACRWWCGRSLLALGLRWTPRAWRDLLAGVAIAALAQTLILLGLLALGMARVSFNADLTAANLLPELAAAFLLWSAVTWQEELWVRGYWLQNIAEEYGLIWGWLISSLFFAALHLFNPNVSLSAELGLVLAGLFLGYGYVRTGYLWMPLGLHFGWNMFEGTVYGFAVSGVGVPRILKTVTSGPDWLTGGTFGPEAGLIVMPALLLGVLLIEAYAGRTNKRSRSD